MRVNAGEFRVGLGRGLHVEKKKKKSRPKTAVIV